MNKLIELLKLVQENPDVPVKFLTHWEVVQDDWGYWASDIESIELTENFIDDCDITERIYTDEDEFLEILEEQYDYTEEEALEAVKKYTKGKHIIVCLGV